MEALLKIIQKMWYKARVCLRPCSVSLTTTSRKIQIGPCLVHAVCVAGDGAAADAQVYDGENANAEEKVHIEALSGTTFNWDPPCGGIFQYGIYIAVNAATTHVAVTYKLLTEEELRAVCE